MPEIGFWTSPVKFGCSAQPPTSINLGKIRFSNYPAWQQGNYIYQPHQHNISQVCLQTGLFLLTVSLCILCCLLFYLNELCNRGLYPHVGETCTLSHVLHCHPPTPREVHDERVATRRHQVARTVDLLLVVVPVKETDYIYQKCH